MLRKPIEVATLGDIVLELHDVGTLLGCPGILLNRDERCSRGTEDRGCQQSKGSKDNSREAHFE